MHLVRLLLVVRYAVYAVFLIAASLWALTATDIGNTVLSVATGFKNAAPRAAGGLLADTEIGREYGADATAALAIAGDSAQLFATRASALSYDVAAALPDAADLASALEGWQTDLLEYEAELRAELGEGVTQEEIERRLDQLFKPQTVARPLPAPPVSAPPVTPAPPAAAEPPVEQPEAPPQAEVEPETPAPAPPPIQPPATTAVAFQPHPVFYKCPVIEVSNSGPVADDRTLTQYTPWIETPAGVLIRAPVAGACLSSGYGTRQVEGASKNHAGVDYYNREGSTIYAAGDGVVTQSGEDGAYGYSVHIDHGAGVEGHYAHMVPGSLKVSVGDRVSLGDEVGIMGASGRAYAVHLHYELRFAGETVDPMYVGKRATY